DRNSKPRIPLPPLQYEAVGATEYLALSKRVSTEQFDPVLTAQAFGKSINLGAWDGTRLVGAARIVTDGYLFAALADIVVDPGYQRRGLGRELLNRAFDSTPRGALQITARAGTGPFFDRTGCERGVSGFVMRRRS
ncbi:MAG: N-acetyltransferase, partial [Gemmatimonadetes bacterium]|nr:N-acetyltransferase [Gemmatimonadota bacterium]